MAAVKRKPKTSRSAKPYEAQGHDLCQTPYYAVEALLPYLPKGAMIWEPARGDGYLSRALAVANFPLVTGDIQTGQNFFEYQPDYWDIIVTNPPYSIKYKWIKRCYDLGKPFALLVPVESIAAGGIHDYLDTYGFEKMLFKQRVDFKMPMMGWGGSAQFPTMWLCHNLLPKHTMFVKLNKPSKKNVLNYEDNFNEYTKRVQDMLAV